ncbi:MAG: enoyl-CoA hydratase-related protein, partial [Candidatus Bathyarchaeia archaeon]
MSEKKISYRVEDRIAFLTINNPPMNAISREVALQLDEAVVEIGKDDNIKAVVFSGEGRAFISGADIRMLKEVKDRHQARQVTSVLHGALNKMEALRKPVIAAIHGYCLGGGLEVALACHMRVAGEKAVFGVPEIKLGIYPGAGGTQRLPRVVGKAK